MLLLIKLLVYINYMLRHITPGLFATHILLQMCAVLSHNEVYIITHHSLLMLCSVTSIAVKAALLFLKL